MWMGNVPKIPADWTESEQWVWKQIAAGERANLNEYDTDQTDPSPDTEKGWGERRRLSSKFLVTILTQKSFTEATSYGGVRIHGALIDDAPLNLEHARLQHLFWLEKSRILVDVKCNNLRVDGGLSFERSFVAGAVDLNGADIRESLYLVEATFEKDVSLNGIIISGGAFLRAGATFKGDLNLGSANIGSNLDMQGSTFEGDVSLNGIIISSSVFLHTGSTFKRKLNLRAANIGSALDMKGSTFEEDVDLTECTVAGAFLLAFSKTISACWKDGASLILRNAHVGTLQDWWQGENASAWPKAYQLEGFTYNRLGTFGGEQEADMLSRPVNSYVEWLKGGPDLLASTVRTPGGSVSTGR